MDNIDIAISMVVGEVGQKHTHIHTHTYTDTHTLTHRDRKAPGKCADE